MNIRLPIITMLAMVMLAGPALAADKVTVKVYLPRTITVNTPLITLGQICVIYCTDSALSEKASAIPMGRCPWANEHIQFDRHTILSRLASSGILADQVQITGSETVTIEGNSRSLLGDDFVQAASDFLQANPPQPKGSSWRPEGQVDDFALVGDGKVQLKTRLAKTQASGFVKVEVAVVDDAGKEQAVRTATFKLGYEQKQAMAAKEIAAGEALTPQNIRIESVLSEKPVESATTPADVMGRMALVRIPAGTLIRQGLMKENAVATQVKRNATVVMKIEHSSFTLTAIGTAMQDGKVGEIIKVQNTDSKRVVNAKVNADGTVTPVFEEAKKT